MTHPSPIVEIDQLHHRYGDAEAVGNITLSLPSGCMIGFIGPDGVGKSTLLSLIAGVRKIQTGRVSVLSGDMADANHRKESMLRIAYMPQGLGKNLYPTLTIAENLHFFGRLFGQESAERNRRIIELLAATRLTRFADRPVNKLSGGMKQKLGLCCALMHDPELLILDEPTTGVDPLSRRQFWELIGRIRERHVSMSVIVATAYMEEAEQFDWLVAINKGKVIATGAPESIRQSTHAETLEAAFISLCPNEGINQKKQAEIVPPKAITTKEMAITAQDLTCRFGDFTAVDHVSFNIRRGEIFGFLGSNGCGKTTTMKMLTGLLPTTEGSISLFGTPLDAENIDTRKRVGYMSQSFSLYVELTVLQNLQLHAKLFAIPAADIPAHVQKMLDDFDLVEYSKQKPEDLPLGIRQRLQLAVALIHQPEILILDEPTSGVDPIARDQFWNYLYDLSRHQGVTIFISTHFMNEAMRCDRISLMHAGRVLAMGTPRELIAEKSVSSLEDAFIAYLQEAVPEEKGDDSPSTDKTSAHFEKQEAGAKAQNSLFSLQRFTAYAWREAIEVIRDPVRLVFAVLGPIILLLTFGYGISLDIEHLAYAVYDQDRTHESRDLSEEFSGSRYFTEHVPIKSVDEIKQRLKRGELAMVLEIPQGFGKNLLAGYTPELAIWLDGAMPFRAETAKSYISGLTQTYLARQYKDKTGKTLPANVDIETRFRYNQSFRSAVAIVPGVVMLIFVLIPSIMTALSITREKETGSIANFHSTPVTQLEFLTGKQLPYVIIFILTFIPVLLISTLVFQVPITGSFWALLCGMILYILSATSFGLLVSSFTNTQVAALCTTAIMSMMLVTNFSGLLVPVSSLSGSARVLGLAFPSSWFQQISIGTFAKGLGFQELYLYHAAIAGFFLFFLGLAIVLLPKQEK